MADKTLYARIKYLTQSASNWSTNNPTLLNGEVGFESDTGKFKIGNGTSPWNSLSYSKVSVIDNLTSTSTTDPLSAKQGKALKDLVDTKTSNTGTVTSVALSLPTIFTVTGSPITTSGTLSASFNGSSSNIICGDGSTTAISGLSVGRATSDASGNVITTTYATKSELEQAMVSAFVYKGTVATTTDLPSSSDTPAPITGDVYYVTADSTMYAYDGTTWEPWGGSVPPATTTTAGIVQIGTGLSISDGVLSLTASNLESIIGSSSANDRLVDFTAKTDNASYDIALATDKTSGSGKLGYGNTSNRKLTFNPSTGTLNSYNYSTNFGDLAEDIECQEDLIPEPGYCYSFDGKYYNKTSTYADEQFIGIHSDTAGYILRTNDKDNKLRVALSGFVLAHVDKEYKPGTPLTCWKDGILTEASSIIRSNSPDLVIAKYWRPEINDTWEGIKVNSRHWVKVIH